MKAYVATFKGGQQHEEQTKLVSHLGYNVDFLIIEPTRKCLFLLIGAHGLITIMSPTVHTPSGSCAKYFFVTRIRLLYSGCGLNRSTSITAVWSMRVDTTFPWSFCAA